MCGRKLGKACLKELAWGRRGGGGWIGLDWTGLGRVGLDWIGLMRGARCKMQDAGGAEKDQAGMKGAGARLMGFLE